MPVSSTIRRVPAITAITALLVAATWSDESWSGHSSATQDLSPGPSAMPAPQETDVAELPPYINPRDGGEVFVVDSGVSVMVDGEGFQSLGYGFVVENASTHVATDTRVQVSLVDESGEVVEVRDERNRVPLLLPGQRFGAGEILLGRSELIRNGPVGLRVTVGGSLWYPADTPGVAFPRLTVLGETVGYVPECEPRVSFTVRSQWSASADLVADVTSVIRDGTGTIIGGTGLRPHTTAIRVRAGTTAHGDRVQAMWGCPAPSGTDRDEITLDLYLNPRGITTEEEEG